MKKVICDKVQMTEEIKAETWKAALRTQNSKNEII